MYPESVLWFQDEDMRKSKAYSVARESFFTRHAVGAGLRESPSRCGAAQGIESLPPLLVTCDHLGTSWRRTVLVPFFRTSSGLSRIQDYIPR